MKISLYLLLNYNIEMHKAHAIEMKMNQQFLTTEKSLCNLKIIQVMCMFSCLLLLQTGWQYGLVYFVLLGIDRRQNFLMS